MLIRKSEVVRVDKIDFKNLRLKRLSTILFFATFDSLDSRNHLK